MIAAGAFTEPLPLLMSRAIASSFSAISVASPSSPLYSTTGV